MAIVTGISQADRLKQYRLIAKQTIKELGYPLSTVQVQGTIKDSNINEIFIQAHKDGELVADFVINEDFSVTTLSAPTHSHNGQLTQLVSELLA